MFRRPKREKPVLTVHFGDVHVGSSLAPWPREVVLADDARWQPSPLQDWYRERWTDFWADTAALKRKHGAWVVGISGGDERDGDHHGTKQLTSADEDDQDQAVEVLYSEAADVVDEWHFVRGTLAHGCATERYARTFARMGWNVVRAGEHWSHWIYTGVHAGVKIEVAHVPGTKSWVPHTRGPTCARHAFYTRHEYQESEIQPPNIVIRHHVHYWEGPGCSGETCCFFIPGWQGASDYVRNKGVKAAAESHFVAGGLRLLCQDGTWFPDWWLKRPETSVSWAK